MALNRRPHVIFGHRGSGKTSLLRKATAEHNLDRQPSAFVDLEPYKCRLPLVGNPHPRKNGGSRLRLVRRLNRPGTAELTPTQLSALYAVDVWGPLRLGELGTVEGIAAPTLTRLVDHLEGRELVRRERDAPGRTLGKGRHHPRGACPAG